MDEFLKIVDVAAHVAGARLAGSTSTMEEVDEDIEITSGKAGLSPDKYANVRYLVNSFLALGDGILYAQKNGTWKPINRIG